MRRSARRTRKKREPRRRPVTSLPLGFAVLLLSSQGADAQLRQEPSQCYQFDRRYFYWTSDVLLGDSALLDTAAVIGDSLIADFTAFSGTWFKVLNDSSLVPWRSVFGDSSAVVMLSPQPHPSEVLLSHTPGARLMVSPAMPELPSTRRIREFSYWRRVQSDSLEVAWRTGNGSTTFRLALQGDTLRGRVRFRIDVIGRAPRFEGAWAVRVACPSKNRTPLDKRMQQTARLEYQRRPLQL